jgi:hypothetical protein
MALGGAVLALGAVAALLFDFGTTAHAVYGAIVITALFFSALGFFRSRRAGRDVRSAIEAAQAVVAGEIIALRGTLDASELARLLGVTLERAEHLVATAQVDHMLSSPDRFRVEGAPPAPESHEDATDAQARSRDRE